MRIPAAPPAPVPPHRRERRGREDGRTALPVPAVTTAAVLPVTGAGRDTRPARKRVPRRPTRVSCSGLCETRSVSPVFVGRTEELNSLNEALARAAAGEPQALLLGR
ncbi:hypothetical protein SVIOM74S_09231 [Streptomyces violarus]